MCIERLENGNVLCRRLATTYVLDRKQTNGSKIRSDGRYSDGQLGDRGAVTVVAVGRLVSASFEQVPRAPNEHLIPPRLAAKLELHGRGPCSETKTMPVSMSLGSRDSGRTTETSDQVPKLACCSRDWKAGDIGPKGVLRSSLHYVKRTGRGKADGTACVREDVGV